MVIFFWGILLLAIAFLSHLIVWKIHLPKRQTKVLLLIFFITLFTGILGLVMFPEISIIGIKAPVSIVEFLHISFLFISVTLAYMITYSAVEVDSPSLVIVIKIAETGTQGLSMDDIANILNDDVLVIPRIRDLITDKMAHIESGRYKLTPKGIFMARLFNFYRSVLKITQEGG